MANKVLCIQPRCSFPTLPCTTSVHIPAMPAFVQCPEWGKPFLISVSLYRYCSFCPRARGQCARAKTKDEGHRHRHCLSRGKCALPVFPQPLMGCTWSLHVPHPPLNCEFMKVLLHSMFLCTCYAFFQGCFLAHMSPPPEIAILTLLFPHSTRHDPVVHFLYSFSVSRSTWCRVLPVFLTSGCVLRTVPGTSTNVCWLNEYEGWAVFCITSTMVCDTS